MAESDSGWEGNCVAYRFDRRQFLVASSRAVAGVALGLCSSGCSDQSGPAGVSAGRSLRKALIVDKPTEEVLKKVRGAGFEGVEAGIVSESEATKARRVADSVGMRIHSVMRGWAKFNSPKRDEVESSLATTIDALKAAEGYGADAILLVPGRIEEHAMPNPWEFCIEFDGKTGHLDAVVERDNRRYGEYIVAHNHAYDSFQAAIHRLIPTAEKASVVIAIENVWNDLFVDARHMAHFIDSFESPWIRAYFDIANHVRYSPPQEWITILGKRIVKCHVKDFKLNPDGRGGRFVDIREGSINWPVVTEALRDIGYQGWMTIEGSEKLSMDERGKRLDLIIAGK